MEDKRWAEGIPLKLLCYAGPGERGYWLRLSYWQWRWRELDGLREILQEVKPTELNDLLETEEEGVRGI